MRTISMVWGGIAGLVLTGIALVALAGPVVEARAQAQALLTVPPPLVQEERAVDWPGEVPCLHFATVETVVGHAARQ